MKEIKSIAVFCGSNCGKSDNYMKAAKVLGNCLVKQSIQLIYGGGQNGIMGEVSKTVYEGSGKVIGVLPAFMKEKYHIGKATFGEEIVVESIHQRKQKMSELADAFIALPGGCGTLEELAEITAWAQLELHNKPIGLLNINGYYNHLIEWLAHSNTEGFTSDVNAKVWKVDEDPQKLIDKLRNS